jgi:hypothetical protein
VEKGLSSSKSAEQMGVRPVRKVDADVYRDMNGCPLALAIQSNQRVDEYHMLSRNRQGLIYASTFYSLTRVLTESRDMLTIMP